MAAQEIAKNLDELIQELLKRARLALQQPDVHTPLQRSCARTLIETHDRARECRASYDEAKEARTLARKEARRAQADRNYYARPDDLGSKVIRFLGARTKRDRKADEAAAAYSDAKGIAATAKAEREAAHETWKHATRDAEQAQGAFIDAFGLPVPRFQPRPEPSHESTPLPPKPRNAPTGPTPPKPRGMRPH